MITTEDVRAAFSNADPGVAWRMSRERVSQPLLEAIRRVMITEGKRSAMTQDQRRALEGPSGRLSAMLEIACDLAMPHYRPFHGGLPQPGDLATEYDEARYFIVSHINATSEQPRPGVFYPEVMDLPFLRRLIVIARSHVGASPHGMKLIGLNSLEGRLGLAGAKLAAKPNGTTCALFLRAALVAAGDQRFVRHPERLTLKTPGDGDLAYGLGIGRKDKRKGFEGLGLNVPLGGHWHPRSPKAAVAGDLYYVSAARGGWKESGHVGLIADVKTEGDSVLVTTIDGGQRNIPDEYAYGSKEWLASAYVNPDGHYVKERVGRFAREGGFWVKQGKSGGGWVNRSVNLSKWDAVEKKNVSSTGKRRIEAMVTLADVPFRRAQPDYGF